MMGVSGLVDAISATVRASGIGTPGSGEGLEHCPLTVIGAAQTLPRGETMRTAAPALWHSHPVRMAGCGQTRCVWGRTAVGTMVSSLLLLVALATCEWDLG